MNKPSVALRLRHAVARDMEAGSGPASVFGWAPPTPQHYFHGHPVPGEVLSLNDQDRPYAVITACLLYTSPSPRD